MCLSYRTWFTIASRLGFKHTVYYARLTVPATQWRSGLVVAQAIESLDTRKSLDFRTAELLGSYPGYRCSEFIELTCLVHTLCEDTALPPQNRFAPKANELSGQSLISHIWIPLKDFQTLTVNTFQIWSVSNAFRHFPIFCTGALVGLQLIGVHE